MPECSYQSSLESYYDGQARPELARQISEHLPACVQCTTELDRLAALSRLLGTARPEPIRPDELARLHQAVDGIEDRGVLRLVAGLSAVAASILIISAAWLYDGPAPSARPIGLGPATEQTWERIAGGYRVPQPAGARPSGTAMRDTTDWMIRGTGGAGENGSR